MSTRSSTPFGLFKVTEAGLYLRDTTISNATSSRHGLLPKLDGNSAHYLDGTGAWTTPAGSGGGGALVFLERHVASSSSSLDFTTFISGTYDKYLLVGEGIVPQTSTASLLLEVGTGGGPSYDTGNNYEWGRTGITSASSTNANDNGATGAAKIFISMGNSAGWSGSFSINACHLQSTSLRKTFHGTSHFIHSSPATVWGAWGCEWLTTGTAATAIRFIMSSGNITSGSITAYGYTNS